MMGQFTLLEIPQLWVRLVCAGVCFALLVVFIVPLFAGIRNAGSITGIIVSLLGAGFFVFNPQLSVWLGRVWSNSHGRILLCICGGLLVLCAVFAVAVSVGMVKAMCTAPKEESTVVILGCKVRGKSPSLMLQRRLDAAYEYLKDHPDVPVIVTGGQGADEEISEAQCMAEYLEGKGISSDRICLEDKSTDTRGNLTNAREFLEQNEWDRHITIVTDGFHQLRAALLAKDLGLGCDAISARTPWYVLPSYWVREWLAVAAYFIFG